MPCISWLVLLSGKNDETWVSQVLQATVICLAFLGSCSSGVKMTKRALAEIQTRLQLEQWGGRSSAPESRHKPCISWLGAP